MMAEREYSAAQLAKKANVKPSFIYDIIHGKSTNPSIIKLAHIANVLNVDIASLVGDEPFTSPIRSTHKKYSSGMQGNRHNHGDYIAISTISVEESLNGSAIVATEEPASPYYFRRDWIRNRLGVLPTDLRLIFVQGDSMEPALCAGDVVLIDLTKTAPTPPGIFILFDGCGLVAKRLELVSHTASCPTVRAISDNPHYITSEYLLADMHIIGRVVWFAREL